jgi:hypothetical protein
MKYRVLIREGQMNIGKCPIPTQDSEKNSENQQDAIEEHEYGPSKKEGQLCSNCVAWDISPRMKSCVESSGGEGYCWMHHFMCQGKKWCNTWAQGGPIKDDEKSIKWEEKSED